MKPTLTQFPLDRPFEETLSNGIPVVLQHFDGAVASFYWWNQVGSVDEQKGEEGFAHFLEHMLFKDANAKDTGTASTGKTARAIESLGGDINAYTSFDQTVYHVTCAEHHWEKVIREFSVMAKPQRFLKADFEREREVIIEELKKNEDSPERQHFQALFSATFKTHPYGRPVIGFEKTLRSATVGQLEAFYRRNYTASRMGLILVGPIADGTGVRVKKLLSLMEHYFGASVFKKDKKPALRAHRRFDPLESSKIVTAKRLFEVQLPSVNFSFRVPELTHPDIAPLDLLSGALSMGESSRLYQTLFSEKSLVTEVSGGVYVPKDPGMFYFHLDVDSPAKLEPALHETFRMIRESRETVPTQQELERVLAHAESEKLYSLQTADGIASRLGFLRFVMENLSHDERYLAELRSVTPERVREAAGRAFDPARLSGAFLIPKKMESEVDTGLVERLARQYLEVPKSTQKTKKTGAKKVAVPDQAPYEEWVLDSGLKVIHRHRPHSHVVSVQVASLGGLRLELGSPLFSKDEDWGVSQCLSMTWTKGTPTRTARQIAETIEGKAASLDGFSGRNTVGLQLTCLAKDFVHLSPVFEDVLVNASFPEEEVAHSRRVMEDTLRSIEDHSGQLCSKFFLESLFLQHPYGALSTGSMQSLATFNSGKIQEYLAQWVRPERSVISIVGNLSRTAVEGWLSRLNAQWKQSRIKTPSRALISGLSAEPALPGPRWVEKRLGREQVHLIRGGLGTTLESKDRHALRLLHTLLGGQSGRLFVELREKQSLAYTVSPMGFEGVEPGYQGVYIACSPDKEKKALQGIETVLKTLVDKGPTHSEMERAREYFLGRRAMDMQSDSSLASYYGLELVYGLTPPTDTQVMERLRSVKPKDIQEVCRKYFVEPHQVTCAVG